MAILEGRPARPEEREEITKARARGYAVSYGDIQTIPGIGVAAPHLRRLRACRREHRNRITGP